jgi:hypothetical protein
MLVCQLIREKSGVERSVDSVSIYTHHGCETVRNCYVIVLDHKLYYSMTRTGAFLHVTDLASVTVHTHTQWYRDSDITRSVNQWLRDNHYTWPLDKQQHAHFLLTFL